MIWDSQYWRHDLHLRAAILRDKQTQRRWRGASFGLVEQAVMLGFYGIRKLAEAKKVPDRVYGQPVRLRSYTAKGKQVTLLNWHRLDDLYDIGSPHETTEPLSFVANQIIHSFVFAPIFGEDHGLESIAFNSDRTRGSKLFRITIDEMVRLFNSVSGSYVGKATLFRASANGDLCAVAE